MQIARIIGGLHVQMCTRANVRNFKTSVSPIQHLMNLHRTEGLGKGSSKTKRNKNKTKSKLMHRYPFGNHNKNLSKLLPLPQNADHTNDHITSHPDRCDALDTGILTDSNTPQQTQAASREQK